MQPTNSQRQEKKIITTKKGLCKSEVAKLGGMYGEEKQIRQKREGRTWEDGAEPENPDCKQARFNVQSTTSNPMVEADIQPRWSQ